MEYTFVHMQTLDSKLIHFFRKISIPAARIALFIVYFWFGILKAIGLSPAGPLVHDLFNHTIHFMSFDAFYMLFAIFECLIGILFLIPGAERVVLPLLLFHMVTTFLPLIFLPTETWQSAFVPTLTGQYILKNVVLIAAAIGIVSHLHPMKKS
jgi:hypothetical protein